MMIHSLVDAFQILRNSSFNGVQGCYAFEGSSTGKTVGIGVMTHGNEPSGLAGFQYFLEKNVKPESGRVIFTLNNLKAAELYFDDLDKPSAQKEIYRFLNLNMNRLPCNLEPTNDEYEIARIKELLPIYETFDYGLDVHSTLNDSEPTIINISDRLDHGLFRGFPPQMKKIISNIANIQIGVPVSKLFGGQKRSIPILSIETGSHEEPTAFETAVSCILQFCKNCGVLPQEEMPEKRSFYDYQTIASIFYPKEDYLTPKGFLAFEELTRNQVLGINNLDPPVLCPVDCLNLFGRKRLDKSPSIAEEAFFLLDFPKLVKL